jgi:hypothetical protein
MFINPINEEDKSLIYDKNIKNKVVLESIIENQFTYKMNISFEGNSFEIYIIKYYYDFKSLELFELSNATLEGLFERYEFIMSQVYIMQGVQ